MTRNRKPRRANRRRPPEDPFDYWLRLVVEIIIEPILDLLRIAWGMIRGVWVQSRSDRRRRALRNGHRRHRDGDET